MYSVIGSGTGLQTADLAETGSLLPRALQEGRPRLHINSTFICDLLCLNYTGAVEYFLAPDTDHIKFGFYVTHRFRRVNITNFLKDISLTMTLTNTLP